MSSPLASVRRLLVVLLPLVAVTACGESPIAPGAALERAGTIVLPANRASFILELTPAGAIDSVLVGAPAGTPGALTVSAVQQGRVLVYSSSALPTTIAFRAFVATETDLGAVTARVTATAAADGAVYGGSEAQVVLR